MALPGGGSTKFVAVAIGGVSSLAEGALPTAMLLRTGTSGLSPTVRRDRDGAQLIMGHVPTIDDGIAGDSRAALLADRALDECVSALASDLQDGRMGIAVSFGPPSGEVPPVSSPVALVVEARLAKVRSANARWRSGPSVCASESVRDPLDVLGEGLGWLATGQADVVFWGAAHTDWSTARLLELEARNMLYDLTALDAVMPGEGAAFIAWMTAERAARAGLAPFIELSGLGTATVDLDDPVDRLSGLAKAAHQASASSDGPDVGWVLSDLTFESQDQLEWEAMVVRMGPRLGRPFVIDNPCRRIGSLGCAAIPLFAATIAASYRAGHVPSPSAMVLARGPIAARARRAALWITRAS